MKKIRYFLEYLLVRFWLFLTYAMGLKLASKVLVKIFRYIGMKLKVSSVAKNNLSMVFPKLSMQAIDKIVLEVWENLALICAETPFLMSMKQAEFNKHIKIIGSENLQSIIGKKALICTGHMANWEIIGKALSNYPLDICGVYRPANNKLVDKLIYDMRNKIKVQMIPKSKNGARQIIRALENNQQIVMLVDQKMNDGIKVPFLGHNAMTAPAIANLAIKYDCPIIPVQIVRTEKNNFNIIIYPSIEHKDKNSKSIMVEINDMIGSWVKENPGQWFWLHKRWISK